MNSIELQFVSGNVFFMGLGMVVAASTLHHRRNGIFLRILLTIISLVGIALVILSATPLPLWLYGLWVGLCVADLIVNNIKSSSDSLPRYRRVLFGAIVVASLILMLVELPHHLTPNISVSSKRPIYVVGDSISAGIGAERKPWPIVLGDLAHVKVTNLARPGATVQTAFTQTTGIPDHGCFVIVEIGGNDMISGTDSRAFYDQLDQLLDKLCSGDNQVIMLEIPLFPFRNSFGSTQRTLAKKHGVTLLPKKFFTNVFGTPDALLGDDLHFAQVGHDAMAHQIYAALSFE